MSIPSGGLSFVDVRDTAKAFIAAMEHGKDKERYLLGSANWTFKRFFDRLERISKVQGPRVALPSKVAVAGSKLVSDLWKQWNWTPPVEPGAVEMAEHFWYISSEKAMRELEFTPREPSETLLDTVAYVREHFLGGSAFGKSRT
jgi:dihydroflavonol-4-reductase